MLLVIVGDTTLLKEKIKLLNWLFFCYEIYVRGSSDKLSLN